MKYAFYLGCNIPARVDQYADATVAVLKQVGVELMDIPQFNCCGYPALNIDPMAFMLSAARNLALAEETGLDMLVMCKCCFGNLKKAAHLLSEDKDLQRKANGALAKEGLTYKGRVEIKHLITVLHSDIGLDTLKGKISRSFKGLKIGTHHGCHALRPSRITRFDDPVSPTLFDELVEITGAHSLDWYGKLDCCGAPLMGINDKLAMDITKKKLENARKAGAHYVCSACPFSHLQFETVQQEFAVENKNLELLGSILFPQLLGLSMGIDEQMLGIRKNRVDVSGVISFLSSE